MMIRHLILAIVLISLLASAPPLEAASRSDLTQGIATCVGRYSAQVDRAALYGQDTDILARKWAWFHELYEAVMPDARDDRTARTELAVARIQAKRDHADLLRTAAAQDDPRRARWAAGQIRGQLATCERLLGG